MVHTTHSRATTMRSTAFSNVRRLPVASVAVVLIVALAITGCGPSGPERIQVHGKVTFDGNPPPGPGTVYFAPVSPAPGFPARGGHGNFEGGTGTFIAGSVKPDDGLMPGTYRVTVECWKSPPRDDGTPGVSYARSDAALPELEVKLDGPNPVTVEYDVPLAK